MSGVHAQEAAVTAVAAEANAEAAEASVELDEVVVTGSRAGARTVASSPAPIDVLTPQVIEKANKSNLLETLNTLLPSYTVANSSNNVSGMVRAGQLRGLNPDQTLVLIDGKRKNVSAFLGAGGFSASAPVDMSMIPSVAIKRIEVLRDGASAIYGSDAIAGVVNLITDDRGEGGEASVRVGQFYEGDGDTLVVKGAKGFKLGDKGHLRLSGEYDDQKIVVRNSPVNPALLFYFPISDATGQPVLPAGTLNSNPSLPAGAHPDPREATRDNNVWRNLGKIPFTLAAASANFGYEISDEVSVYAVGTYGHRSSDAIQNFRTPNRDEVVRAIFPDGYTPIEAIREDDYWLLGGVRGSNLYGWDYDLSLAYGRDDIDTYVFDSLNPTYGLQSQTDFFIGNQVYSARTLNFDLKRSFEDLPIPIDASFGLEQRHERFILSPGDVQSYSYGGAKILDGPNAGKTLSASLGGSQALPGYRPEDAQDVDRDSLSLYIGATLHPLKAWTIDLAGRTEDYSDFGRTNTYRLSTRYEINPSLAIRGTVSTGFEAPALAAQSYKNTANANTAVNHVLQVGSPEAIALGAKPLEPQKSTNYSAGIVARAFGFGVAIDAYQIDVKDRITQSTQFNNTTYPGSGVLVAGAGFAFNDGVSYFINAVDTRNRGLEVTVEKSTDFGRYGAVRWTYAANRNYVQILDIAPTPAVLAAFSIPVFSAGAQTNLKNQVPKTKHIFGAYWSKDKFSVDLRETYYGHLTRTGNPTIIPTTGPWAGQRTVYYDIGSLWVTDLSVSYDFSEQLRGTVSVNNLTNVKPTKLPDPLLSPWQLYSYTNNGPIGPEGGFYSATFGYRF